MARRSALVFLPLVLLLLFPVAAFGADDKEKVAEAKKLADDIEAARKAKDGAALGTHIKAAAAMHNGVEDKGAKGKLQKALGAVIKTKGLEDLYGETITALSEMDDGKGAYKQLKRFMPTAKDKTEIDEYGEATLAAVGKLAPESAIGDLLDLAEKSRDYKAAGGAIAALGQFKAAKKRVMILESLVKLISRFMPPRGQQVGEETQKRWDALAQPLVVACNTLTARKETSPDSWLNLWKENKKKPEGLFNE